MFEWNKEKARLNEKKHGVGFSEAAQIFFTPYFAMEDKRREYGEIRFNAPLGVPPKTCCA